MKVKAEKPKQKAMPKRLLAVYVQSSDDEETQDDADAAAPWKLLKTGNGTGASSDSFKAGSESKVWFVFMIYQ